MGKMMKDIKDYFITNDKRITGNSSIELVEQRYWGNLKDPDIIIFGKNPSYSIDDEIDNAKFGDLLNENLNYYDRDDTIINCLMDTKGNFVLSGTSRWWRTAFENWPYNNKTQGRDGNSLPNYEEYANYPKRNELMKKIAIFNLYGYYSEYTSDAVLESSKLDKSHMNGILKDVKKAISNAKYIYFMWGKSVTAWLYILCKRNEEQIIDMFKDKNLYIVNGNCSSNHRLINSKKIELKDIIELLKC